MAFFVPPDLQLRQQRSQKRSEPVERTDLLLLSNAKKMGLSFDEVNMFRVRDLVEFTDIYFADVGDGNRLRDASQEDIDRLLM